MSSNIDLEVRRREISTLVDEVRASEQQFRDCGVEIADEGDWLEVRDIFARIERRLLANLPAQDAAE